MFGSTFQVLNLKMSGFEIFFFLNYMTTTKNSSRNTFKTYFNSFHKKKFR